MSWTDNVASTRNHATNTTASATAHRTAEATYGTWSATCITSAAIVPKIPTITTANQYAGGTYRCRLNCTANATTNPTKPTTTASSGATACTAQSDVDSPSAVDSPLMIQNIAPISGTRRAPRRRRTVSWVIR